VKSIIPKAIADQSWPAIITLCLLALVGGTALFSVAGGSFTPWAATHAMRFVLFMGMAMVLSYIPVSLFRVGIIPAALVSIALLILVLAVGFVGGGARSWLNLGFMQLQPSELVKISLVGLLARYFEVLSSAETSKLRALWPPLLITAIPFLLIAAQPDLGTAMLLMLTSVIVCFLAGMPLKWFVGAGLAGAISIPLAYNFLLLPHQQLRLTIFLNPEDDPLGGGYHISQSSIAIGSGGIFGKGYLNGSQSHLHYLPETHTDFIFPAIAEEWGLAGGLVIMLLFGVLLRWGMNVSRHAATRFEKLLGAGLTCSLFLYIAINLMMVMGMAPVVGIPLPLVSYGGSAMLSAMLSVGVLMSIDRENRKSTRHFRSL